jgi:hypothetical protein
MRWATYDRLLNKLIAADHYKRIRERNVLDCSCSNAQPALIE